MSKNNLLVILLLLCQSYLCAQIPDDFNFLNNSRKNSVASSIVMLDSSMLSIGKDGVDIMGYDYTLEKHSIALPQEYKFIEGRDSNYYFTAWELQSGDALYSGPTTIQVNAKGEVSRDEYDMAAFVGTHNTYMESMTYDTSGGWWCLYLRGTKLAYMNDGDIIISFDTNRLRGELFTSCAGDIYIADRELYYFDGEELEVLFDLPEDASWYNHGDYNYAMKDKTLIKYDCALENKIHEWVLPYEIQSFAQLDFLENNALYVKSFYKNYYALVKIDDSSNAVFEFKSQVNEAEEVTGIKVLSDSTHVVFGQHQFALSHQTFYRNVNTNHEIDYPLVDATVSDFKIDYTFQDSIDLYHLDSIFLEYDFDATVFLFNNSEDTFYNTTLYSGNFFNSHFFIDSSYIFMRLNDDVQPDNFSVISYKQSNADLNDLPSLQIELTGVNYKFLKDGPVLLDPKLTTSILETQIFRPLSVYPNPTYSTLNFAADNISNIKVFDAFGQLVLSREDGQIKRLDVSLLGAGLYYLLAIDASRNKLLTKFNKQ